MRRFGAILFAATALMFTPAVTADRTQTLTADRTQRPSASERSITAGPRRTLPGDITVRVPPGWHIVHGWLSDVLDPVPRLAVATFRVRLSRHTCECGSPNVVHFPRRGAFVFMWEYLDARRQQLDRVPRRPAQFRLSSDNPTHATCFGPSTEFDFKEAGRVFQTEVYLGPAVDGTTRAQLLALMDSFRALSRP